MADVVARFASRAHIASLAVATGGRVAELTDQQQEDLRKSDRLLRDAYDAISRR